MMRKLRAVQTANNFLSKKSKRKQATMPEWIELGETAKQVRQQLIGLGTLMSGKTRIKYQDKLIGIINQLDRLRSDLEDELFLQHPFEAHINVFYGQREASDLLAQLFAEKYARGEG